MDTQREILLARIAHELSGLWIDGHKDSVIEIILSGNNDRLSQKEYVKFDRELMSAMVVTRIPCSVEFLDRLDRNPRIHCSMCNEVKTVDIDGGCYTCGSKIFH